MSNNFKNRLITYAKFNYMVLGKEEAKSSYEGTSLYDLCAKALKKIGINQNSMETKKFVSKNIGTMNTYLLRNGEIKQQVAKKQQKKSTLKIKKKFTPYKPDFVQTNEFLSSYEWRKIRLEALLKYGRKCLCCGSSPETGAVLNVDHIKPRKTHPELALCLDNLQVLCHECNHGKGNWNDTDFRQKNNT